jgi:hypothetical protein
MPRATGNDLCELFGYAPDDRTDVARRQWKSQECPFAGDVCIKHSHPQGDGTMVVYGSCSVRNATRGGVEEVILCPQRFYADNYAALKSCLADALGRSLPVYLAGEYAKKKRSSGALPSAFGVLLGQKSGGEISLSNPGVIDLSLDWVIAVMERGKLSLIVPCEVQSIDTTGNYHANWAAYSKELSRIPDSKHGMNWANVWKRLIPQIILKGSIASTSTLCTKGMYFLVPDRVYRQFEKLVGPVKPAASAGHGVLTVMTYELGPHVATGEIRSIVCNRTIRMLVNDFATAFASGKQLPLGSQLDEKVTAALARL